MKVAYSLGDLCLLSGKGVIAFFLPSGQPGLQK
jgi:hypothetical protein